MNDEEELMEDTRNQLRHLTLTLRTKSQEARREVEESENKDVWDIGVAKNVGRT